MPEPTVDGIMELVGYYGDFRAEHWHGVKSGDRGADSLADKAVSAKNEIRAAVEALASMLPQTKQLRRDVFFQHTKYGSVDCVALRLEEAARSLSTEFYADAPPEGVYHISIVIERYPALEAKPAADAPGPPTSTETWDSNSPHTFRPTPPQSMPPIPMSEVFKDVLPMTTVYPTEYFE